MIIKMTKSGALIALCIILALSCVSCSLLDIFDLGGASGTQTTTAKTDNSSNNTPVSIAKKSGVYTILFLNEGGTEGSLSSLFICSIDTAEDYGVSFLQIPIKTYVNNAYTTIAGVYSGNYNSSLSDGNTADRARESAILAVKSIIESHFCVYVDYYLWSNPSRLGVLCEKIGGVDINVPYSMLLSNGETLMPGVQSLSGGTMAAFLSYSGFSDAVLMNVYKVLISTIYTKIKAEVTNDRVSLFVIEVRNCVVTDIPSSGGEDIFFTRKLISTESDGVKFTQASTQSCAVSSGVVEVIRRSSAVKLINDFLHVYAVEFTADMFDPDKMFTDDNNQLVSIIYTGSGSDAPVYTAANIKDGQLTLT